MSGTTRILHIFGSMDRGGAQMRTIEMMQVLRNENFQFDFCCLSGREGELDAQIRELGGNIFYCPIGRGFSRTFRRILRGNRPNIVHSHVHHFSGYILRLAAAEGIEGRVAHFRNTEDGRGNNILRQGQRAIMKRWIDAYATDILAVSRGAMQASWRKNWTSDSRCRVIYNGLDVRPFATPIDRVRVRSEFGFEQACPVVIHVGRFNPVKNHRFLIEFFGEFVTDMPDARLLLVGRGEQSIEEETRNQVDALGLRDKVVFAGSRDDVPSLLRTSNLMVFPSLHEGLPGAVLEACAAGIAVLANDLPGVREIANQFPTVTVLSINESAEAWSSAARRLLAISNPSTMSSDAVERFRLSAFTIDKCVEEHRKVWERSGKNNGISVTAG